MEKRNYSELKNRIMEARSAYESPDKEPIMSDYEYDMLMQELKQMEKDDPSLVDASSPTQTVADMPSGSLERVTHNVPMLSIQDVFTKNEVSSWVGKVRALHPDARFCVERKIDGLSMTLRYENGVLTLAETRGDGYIGEIVTDNAMSIAGVPHKISEERYLEVRGEVYMTRADFEAANRRQEELGKKLFANPRNCASGTLRKIGDSEGRKLSFLAFNIQDGPAEYLEGQHAGLAKLSDMGFRNIGSMLCANEQEVLTAIDEIGDYRDVNDFDIDGAVVKIDQVAYRNDISGGSAKYANGHIAYKYPPEEKETVIRDIELTVGMSGRVTPTAVFDPLYLCGTTVTRATLHNQDFIDKLHIGIGDTVVVYKSGEIIPKIKCSVPEKRPDGVKDFQIPMVCPVCGGECVREEGAADIRCINASCPAQLARKLLNFADRTNMDIRGFGPEAADALVEQGMVRNFADLYTLKDKRELLVKSGIIGKAKGTDNLLNAIEATKANDAWRLLAGLGIENVGATLSKPLLRRYGSIQAVADASIESLTEMDGIGRILAENIHRFFANPKNREMLTQLEAEGVKMVADAEPETTASLVGPDGKPLVFVITGDVHIYKNRQEFKDSVEKRGGKVSGSVSKKVTALVINDPGSTTSKAVKARQLGVQMLTEEEFIDKYAK